MRKIMLVSAVCVVLTLSACGSGSTTNQSTDSTSVQVDTTSVPVSGGDSSVVNTDSTKEVEQTK